MQDGIPFIKMHGLGNDFVIIDNSKKQYQLTTKQIQKICHRHLGVGCDQLVIIGPVPNYADAFVQFFNADGSDSNTCGNATRCVAYIIMEERCTDQVIIATEHDMLKCSRGENKTEIEVVMGKARMHWSDIPLAYDCDTMALPLDIENLPRPIAVNMGNPHIVFFIEDCERLAVEAYGSLLEHNALFPQRVNVNFAHIIDPHHVRLRVWERGSGETWACGSGACATVWAGIQKKQLADQVTVELKGGKLSIRVTADGIIHMKGMVATSFMGEAYI